MMVLVNRKSYSKATDERYYNTVDFRSTMFEIYCKLPNFGFQLYYARKDIPIVENLAF